ncbi:MAG: ribbon-helix-helix domain-containing protein [Thermoanaerobaculia bacterium]
MKTITVKVPEPLARSLDDEAQRSGRPRSDVVREAVAEYLARPRRARRARFGELVADLRGSVSGPADLSTNPRHFEGFGE